MKKKLATILLFVFAMITVLTGCNLFDTNNYMALSSIVATNGDVTITREELITRYNNGGYYYTQYYGLTNEEAFTRMIDELIEEKYLLSYIDSLGGQFALDSQDYSDIVSDTWDYINQGMATYIKEVRKTFNLSTDDISLDDESSDPEYATQKQYETKFELIDGVLAYIEPEDTKEHKLSVATLTTAESALNYAQTHYSYKRQIRSGDDDLKLMVWNRYISALKSSQRNYNYDDMSDTAVFNREVKRLFDYNLKTAKTTKFEEESKKLSDFNYSAEVDGGRYVLNSTILEKMVTYYSDLYLDNKDAHDLSTSQFYKDLTSTSNRDKYVYFGEYGEEKLITCTHILIKLSSDQTEQISAIEGNSLYQGDQKTDAIARIKSADNTKAYERDLTTGEVIDDKGISVTELYNAVTHAVNGASSLEAKIEAFNNYLYRYNVDTGIINAQFDYVVGTENSAMVETFTNLVRDLYDDGEGAVGSIGITYEEGSYSGYHIVMYTGVLENIFVSKTDLASLNADNIYEILSGYKTSISYGETMFDFVYDKTTSDNYSKYKEDVLSTLKSGKGTEYNVGNYQDLYR